MFAATLSGDNILDFVAASPPLRERAAAVEAAVFMER